MAYFDDDNEAQTEKTISIIAIVESGSTGFTVAGGRPKDNTGINTGAKTSVRPYHDNWFHQQQWPDP